MKLSLVGIEPKQGLVKLGAEGEITSRDFLPGSKNPIENILGEAWASNNVLLSLEKVSFIDSTAIGWLIDCQRKCNSAGGQMVVHTAAPTVRQLFDLLKLRQVLRIVENEAAARESLATEAK